MGVRESAREKNKITQTANNKEIRKSRRHHNKHNKEQHPRNFTSSSQKSSCRTSGDTKTNLLDRVLEFGFDLEPAVRPLNGHRRPHHPFYFRAHGYPSCQRLLLHHPLSGVEVAAEGAEVPPFRLDRHRGLLHSVKPLDCHQAAQRSLEGHRLLLMRRR